MTTDIFVTFIFFGPNKNGGPMKFLYLVYTSILFLFLTVNNASADLRSKVLWGDPVNSSSPYAQEVVGVYGMDVGELAREC